MGYSEQTPNYNLPQYVGGDRPSYLGDWNEAMGIIDAGMTENKNDITDNGNKIVNLTTRLSNDESDITTALENSENALEQVGNVYTKTQSDSRYTPMPGEHMVVIGDSYCTGYQPSGSLPTSQQIPTLLANLFDKTLHNYAVSGSGFVTSGDGATFGVQETTAATDTSFNNADVSLVFVIGGRNDSTSSVSAAGSLAAKISTDFPNAKFYYFALWDAVRNFSATQWANFNGNANAFNAVKNGCGTYFSTSWGLLKNSYYASGDDIHPNASGAEFLAGLIKSSVMGLDTTQSGAFNASGSYGADVRVSWSGFDAIVTIQGSLTGGVADLQVSSLAQCLSFDVLAIGIIRAGASFGWARGDVSGNNCALKIVGGSNLSGGNFDNSFFRIGVTMGMYSV